MAYAPCLLFTLTPLYRPLMDPRDMLLFWIISCLHISDNLKPKRGHLLFKVFFQCHSIFCSLFWLTSNIWKKTIHGWWNKKWLPNFLFYQLECKTCAFILLPFVDFLLTSFPSIIMKLHVSVLVYPAGCPCMNSHTKNGNRNANFSPGRMHWELHGRLKKDCRFE